MTDESYADMNRGVEHSCILTNRTYNIFLLSMQLIASIIFIIYFMLTSKIISKSIIFFKVTKDLTIFSFKKLFRKVFKCKSTIDYQDV